MGRFIDSLAPGGETPFEALISAVAGGGGQKAVAPKAKAPASTAKSRSGAGKYKDQSAQGTGWSYVNPQGVRAANVNAPLAHERAAVYQGAGQPYGRRNFTLGDVSGAPLWAPLAQPQAQRAAPYSPEMQAALARQAELLGVDPRTRPGPAPQPFNPQGFNMNPDLRSWFGNVGGWVGQGRTPSEPEQSSYFG